MSDCVELPGRTGHLRCDQLSLHDRESPCARGLLIVTQFFVVRCRFRPTRDNHQFIFVVNQPPPTTAPPVTTTKLVTGKCPSDQTECCPPLTIDLSITPTQRHERPASRQTATSSPPGATQLTASGQRLTTQIAPEETNPPDTPATTGQSEYANEREREAQCEN
jgi:hypothetical protein